MGWVTLTLRKTELKRTHSDYQNRLLDISRTKRRMARESEYQQMLVINDCSEERDSIFAACNAKVDPLKANIAAERANPTAQDANGNPVIDQSKIDEWTRQINEAIEERTRQINEAEKMRDDELQSLENEASDEELILDQEQIQIETQLEAIKAELDAVGEAISSQIQDSTIKLS